MDVLNIINAVVVSLGIPTIIGAAIYIGKKLQILDDLKAVRDKFAVVESRVSDLWEAKLSFTSSPRQLNEIGNRILTESGINTIIESKQNDLLRIVKEKNPSTAYDAERIILDTVMKIPELYPNLVNNLKEGAFRVGKDIDTLLFVGGLHLRNRIFETLGFSLTDLDKPKK